MRHLRRLRRLTRLHHGTDILDNVLPLRRTVKPLLSDAVTGIVPAAIRRRRKAEFAFPFADRLRAELRGEVEETLFWTPCPPLDSVLSVQAVTAASPRYLVQDQRLEFEWPPGTAGIPAGRRGPAGMPAASARRSPPGRTPRFKLCPLKWH